MGEPKLTAEEREALRQWCASEGLVDVEETSIIRHHSDADALTRRLLDEHASLERDLARLNEMYQLLANDNDGLERDLAELRKRVERIALWTHTYGAALRPTAGSSDSFGDGMRAAKQQVRDLLALLPAEPPKEASDGK